MNPTIAREYARLRARGELADAAMRAARVHDAWIAAGDLVRLVAEPECEPHDTSYVDTWGETPARTKRIKQEINAQIDRDGLWFWRAEYRLTCAHEWECADGIGDIIGDVRDSGYDVDLKRSALDALDAAREKEARAMADRATFAAGA